MMCLQNSWLLHKPSHPPVHPGLLFWLPAAPMHMHEPGSKSLHPLAFIDCLLPCLHAHRSTLVIGREKGNIVVGNDYFSGPEGEPYFFANVSSQLCMCMIALTASDFSPCLS